MFESIKSRKGVEQTYMASVLVQGIIVLGFAVYQVMAGTGLLSIPTVITGFALLRVAYSPDEVIMFSLISYGVAFIVGLVFLFFVYPSQTPAAVIPGLSYFHIKILYLLITGGTLVHSYFTLLSIEDKQSGPI